MLVDMSIIVPRLRIPSVSKKVARNPWPPLPPERETTEERCTRRRMETEAKSRSDSIDLQLRLEREEKAKNPPEVKILLLGQAESGKSTVVKNFQLQFTPKAFRLEAQMWGPVIQLNLVRSVNFIVAFIPDRGPCNAALLSPKIRTLCCRLAPLRRVEEDLVKILSRRASLAMQNLHSSFYLLENAGNGSPRFRSDESTICLSESDFNKRYGPNRRVLDALGEDIAALWQDESLQKALKSAGIALEEQPGFFLDHAVRVTRVGYKPRLDDVLRARVTTTGPVAHTIVAEGHEKQWTIYDVGGSRHQRATWAQFFDDVNAIIFLAPLSGFNQVLNEDKDVNRLADSLRLWQLICSNKLLASVEFVLLLNKMDILDSKLKSGIQFSSFAPSYADRPNETKHVTQFLLNIFATIHKQYSPKQRKLHSHLTCAVDTTTTSIIIQRIQEFILIKLLSEVEML